VQEGTKTTQFIRQKDGGWDVKEPKEQRGLWRLNKTTVSVTTADGGGETDLAQLLTIPVNPDWRTLKELNLGKTKVRIDRRERGAKVTFEDGRKTKECEIQWPEITK